MGAQGIVIVVLCDCARKGEACPMNISKERSKTAVLSLVFSLVFLCTIVISPSAKSAQKFRQAATIHLNKGCGDGLDANSACGSCVVVGIAFTKGASCSHVCVRLPNNGKPNSAYSVEVVAGEDTGPGPAISRCGGIDAAGPCPIGWSRFEGREYYQNTNELCARVKNWSHDRDRQFRVIVTEK